MTPATTPTIENSDRRSRVEVHAVISQSNKGGSVNGTLADLASKQERVPSITREPSLKARHGAVVTQTKNFSLCCPSHTTNKCVRAIVYSQAELCKTTNVCGQ
jgi:hypothetical protein